MLMAKKRVRRLSDNPTAEEIAEHERRTTALAAREEAKKKRRKAKRILKKKAMAAGPFTLQQRPTDNRPAWMVEKERAKITEATAAGILASCEHTAANGYECDNDDCNGNDDDTNGPTDDDEDDDDDDDVPELDDDPPPRKKKKEVKLDYKPRTAEKAKMGEASDDSNDEREKQKGRKDEKKITTKVKKGSEKYYSTEDKASSAGGVAAFSTEASRMSSSATTGVLKSIGYSQAPHPPPLERRQQLLQTHTQSTQPQRRAQPQPWVLANRERKLRELLGRYNGLSAANMLRPPYEVFLKYLPHDATEDAVVAFFEGCGEIIPPGPKLMRDPATGRVIRGFVTFATAEGCIAALARDLERLGGRGVSVSLATSTGTMQAEGTHTPAMFEECVKALGVSRFPNGVFVDGTFGRGGHTKKILAALGPFGELHGFDMDEEAVAVGRELEGQDRRFHMHHAPFSRMFEVLSSQDDAASGAPSRGFATQGMDPPAVVEEHRCNRKGRAGGGFVHGVLIDIGISSPQLDGGRGFRPEFDGPLDMRFDVSPTVETALGFLRRVERHELAAVIVAFGGEHPLAARRIADAVALAKRNGALPESTVAFARLVSDAKGKEYQAMHPAKMTFQALRIAVNREYEELRSGLKAAMELIRDGGKTAVLTWKHSECSILVDFARRYEIAPPNQPLRSWFETQRRRAPSSSVEKERTTKERVTTNTKKQQVEYELTRMPGVIVEDAKRPTADEVRINSRSRSAVLHVLRRETGMRMADLESIAETALGWDPYELPAGDF